MLNLKHILLELKCPLCLNHFVQSAKVSDLLALKPSQHTYYLSNEAKDHTGQRKKKKKVGILL